MFYPKTSYRSARGVHSFPTSLLFLPTCSLNLTFCFSSPPHTHTLYKRQACIFLLNSYVTHSRLLKFLDYSGCGYSTYPWWRQQCFARPLSDSLHLAASTPLRNDICFPPVLIKPLYPHASLCSDAVLFNSQYPVVFSNTCLSIPFPYVCCNSRQ